MKEKLPFKVIKGGLVVAGNWCAERLRQRKYKAGDLVFITISKPRNPEFNKFMHAGFAQALIDNIEEFKHLSRHDALKFIQVAGNIECEVFCSKRKEW